MKCVSIFYLFVICDRASQNNLYMHAKVVLEISVTCEQRFDINMICELYCIA